MRYCKANTVCTRSRAEFWVWLDDLYHIKEYREGSKPPVKGATLVCRECAGEIEIRWKDAQASSSLPKKGI